MQESVQAAYSYIRSQALNLEYLWKCLMGMIFTYMFQRCFTPKDGPLRALQCVRL